MRRSALMLFLFCSLFSRAQTPFVKIWDKRFGGTDGDNFTFMQQTFDEGFLLGGWSQSGMGGDKSEPSWGSVDYWIVKTDSLGVKQWDKRYGGFGAEYLYC